MKTRIINKDEVLKSVTKMLADKNLVRSYLKGKTSIKTITEQGIRFAKLV
jgi:predicted transcriptional regulator